MGHYVNCEQARALLAEATPEVVRRADAAPQALKALRTIHRGLGLDPNVGRPALTRRQLLTVAGAAIAKTEGR